MNRLVVHGAYVLDDGWFGMRPTLRAGVRQLKTTGLTHNVKGAKRESIMITRTGYRSDDRYVSLSLR